METPIDAEACLDTITAAEAAKILATLEPEKSKSQVTDELKKVAKNAKARIHARTKLKKMPPIRRNTLCPCGSGRKLKRCCIQMARDFRNALEAGVSPDTIRTRHSFKQPLIQGEDK